MLHLKKANICKCSETLNKSLVVHAERKGERLDRSEMTYSLHLNGDKCNCVLNRKCSRCYINKSLL